MSAMNRKVVWFEVVQVIRRNDSGTIVEWWPGDQLSSLYEAQKQKHERAYQHRGTEFSIIRHEVTESGRPLKAKVLASKPAPVEAA